MNLTSPTTSNIHKWLEQEMIAKGGGIFTPANDVWRPDVTAMSANIKKAKCAVQEEIQPWLIAAITYYAKERAARTLNFLVNTLVGCAVSGFDVLDDANAIAIRNRFSKTEFSILRTFLKRWREEYMLAVCPSERAVSALYALKTKETFRPCPVESMNPLKGPYTVLETQALFDWANDAFTNDRVSFERFVYIRLLIATGARKRQLQQLVFGDLTNTKKGPILQIPKAKQRAFEYRSGFQSCNLSADLYNLLQSYQKLTLKKLQAERPHIDWDKALPNVPIFRSKGSNYGHAVIIDAPDLNLLEVGPLEKFHCKDGVMTVLLDGTLGDQPLPVSERTGEKIHLGSHRFRYTLGTDLSRMGFGPHSIASVLGHKSIRCVGKYIKTSTEMGKRIDTKMKSELALVVNAFQGRLVANSAEADNGFCSNKIIRSQSSPIATCGASGGCQLDAPVACYTCSRFQPWIEGPHKEVLERLQQRQQRAVDAAGENCNEAISFDRPILAVMQVIHKIEVKKRQKKGVADE